jgi:hypothetical protein
LPWLIGCLPEEEIDDAKKFFLRSCYKDVTIHDVVPVKRNCQPSCAWRVLYKMRDRTPDFVETGKSGKDFIIPLPDNDEELKKLFVCNRTRNEHFACLEQAAKLNFAAVALTTAVKVKVISIFIYYHNYNISISIFAV